VEYALGHPALGRDFRRYLKGLDVDAAQFREETAPELMTRAGGARRRKGNGSARERAGNGNGTATPASGSGARRRVRAEI